MEVRGLPRGGVRGLWCDGRGGLIAVQVVLGHDGGRELVQCGPVLSRSEASVVVRRHHIERDVLNRRTHYAVNAEQFERLHDWEEGPAEYSVLREVLVSVLAVTQWVYEQTSGVTHRGVGLTIVSVVCCECAQKEDVVPTCPEC